MIFMLLFLVSLIPLSFVFVIFLLYRIPLSKVVIIYLAFQFLGQVNISLLYSVNLFDEQTVHFLYKVLNIANIYTTPVIFLISRLLIKYVPSEDIFYHHHFNWVNKRFFYLLLVFSTIVYIFSWSNFGIAGLELKTYHDLSYFYPHYGSLGWIFFLNDIIGMLGILLLIFITFRLKEASLRIFCTYLSTAVFLIFIIGILSKMEVIPIFFSNFGSVLSTIIIFTGFFTLQSNNLSMINIDLKEYRYLLAKIIHLNPSYIYVKDFNHRFILINSSLKQLYGLSEKEMIGRKETELDNNSQRATTIEQEERFILENKVKKNKSIEVIESYQGEKRIIEVTKIPIHMKGKLFLLCIGNDVTELKKTGRLYSSIRKDECHRRTSCGDCS
ncbi:PAS domain S-box protein [Bacillus carboniphilus]|uniref:PAS domain S-box protein n=1 Tax=Bacillus carboniphilus TaxID=86663 RepID=A0ABY9JS16_9BACI|nr:PAS domain S-box protein [Bacillus carboniphilus]WLR41278.1 PAS domain S-box protein [Bacillus carboniphilus]